MELPSAYQPGQKVALHLFGRDKWLDGCSVVAVSFMDNGRVLYDVEVSGHDGATAYVMPAVPSQWVVSRVGAKNQMADISDFLFAKTANEI